MRLNWILVTVSVLLLVGCGANSELPIAAGTGPDPALPEVRDSLLPLVHVAPVERWQAGEKPVAAPGLEVSLYADKLDHPRWLYVLPNGDVLVAETNAQPKKPKGLIGRIEKLVMKRAGATVPSADRITLLRDADGDGEVDIRSVFLSELTSPFGMSLVGDRFYVANTNAVVGFPYVSGATRISEPGRTLVALPAGDNNRHWTKGLIASQDGRYLYAAIGSNSDHAENGIEEEEGRAAIWRIDIASGDHTVFASGLRNPVGMAFEPVTGMLWTAVNERDDLGGDLVPDYMTSVREGGFYGWPYSYFGDNLDPRVREQRPDLVAKALVPDYALGSHTASLGLAFAGGQRLGPTWGPGAYIGQHGSWNRKPRSGYKVIFVPFDEGRPAGQPVDVLTGFLSESGNARGRPVGVAIDAAGALLVADDVGNAIWRVTPASE